MEGRKPLSFVVEFWSSIFFVLGKISLFAILRTLITSNRAAVLFVEFYVLFNTFASVIILIIVSWRREEPVNWLLLFVTCYGSYRIFEIVIYQFNVLIFDQYRAEKIKKGSYKVRGYRRIILLLLHNYVEIVCWFGVAYLYLYRLNHIKADVSGFDPNFINVFRESLILMFSFNPDKYSTETDIAAAVFSVQAIIGLFMTIMVVARFLSSLPAPESMDEFENEGVYLSEEQQRMAMIEVFIKSYMESETEDKRHAIAEHIESSIEKLECNDDEKVLIRKRLLQLLRR